MFVFNILGPLNRFSSPIIIIISDILDLFFLFSITFLKE